MKNVVPAGFYKVVLGGRKVNVGGRSYFLSYEAARRAVRSLIRRKLKAGKVERLGLWDGVSRNPTSVNEYGYRIVRL